MNELFYYNLYSNHIKIQIKHMESQYSTISISIPKVKPSHLQKDTYLYEIDVATRWGKWHLQKRYQQFQQLHKFLNKQFNDLPEFPESILGSWLGQSHQTIQQYRDILQDYMRITSLRKDIISSDFYSEFLQLQKHSQNMLANKPTFQGQFQLEDRIGDEGKIIVDFYHHENYMIFATGNDSPLEKFNGFLANTRFPWQDEEEAEFILPLGTVQCWKLKKKPFSYMRIWARNYPTEVKKLLFLPQVETMIVGLSDGGIQIFKLVPRGNNIYYEVIRMIKIHQDCINGLYLDQINMILYSTSVDGWLNVSDARNGALLDSIQYGCEVTGLHGEGQNMKLAVALDQGNIQIFQYDHRSKLKLITTLGTPDASDIRCMKFDRIKNYFFAGGHDTGNIYIYDLPKPGKEKLMKQVATLKNKAGIVSLHWIPQKMELIVVTEKGQVFFWDSLKGKQIYMLRPFNSEVEVATSKYIAKQNILIIVSKNTKLVKFYQLPKTWRDATVQAEQQRQIQIRRKVQNLYKVRQAIKRKSNDSDDDDLACWYASDSSEQEEESWLNFEF